MESSRRIKLKGLLICAIWMILHTRTHPSMHAENTEPKKAFQGLKKVSEIWKKGFFCKYCSKFDGALHRYGLHVLCAPTHGWLRCGVRLTLEKKWCTIKLRIIVLRELIETNNTNENEFRLRQFQRRSKAFKELS